MSTIFECEKDKQASDVAIVKAFLYGSATPCSWYSYQVHVGLNIKYSAKNSAKPGTITLHFNGRVSSLRNTMRSHKSPYRLFRANLHHHFLLHSKLPAKISILFATGKCACIEYFKNSRCLYAKHTFV